MTHFVKEESWKRAGHFNPTKAFLTHWGKSFLKSPKIDILIPAVCMKLQHQYPRLIMLFKRDMSGHVPKKSKVFSREQINDFPKKSYKKKSVVKYSFLQYLFNTVRQ